MKTGILIGVLAVALLGAVVIIWSQTRPPQVPRRGEAAVVVTPSGFRQSITWDQVFAAAQRGSDEAYLDQVPGGGWMYKASNGEFGRVMNPGDADPKFPGTPANR